MARLGALARIFRWAMLAWYRGQGWAPEGRLPPDRKFVLVGAPHTSNWDFAVFVGTIDALGREVRFMGKKSLFGWPLGGLMRGLGGVPVDRGGSDDLVAQMTAEFERHDDFILVIAPEGTRGRATRWRSGFYRIALAARVPLVCAGPDYTRRRGVIGPVIRPTGNYARDLVPAFAFFRTLGGKHPQRGFIP